MIPLRLQLRNFLSYRESTVLPFDGFRLACLSGNNGHGKSALLDAITWALWGRARAKSEDDLIHFGQTEAEVEYEFELVGPTGRSPLRYRVLRKRARRLIGRSIRGFTTLDFQVQANGGYRSIAGNTVSETQRKIDETLRLDYDTFVNSSFILQGRADSFTLRPPADRKKVLADLLNLGLYDTLEERAKERAKEREALRHSLQDDIRAIDQELSRRGEYERQRQEAQAALDQLEGQAQAQEEELKKLRDAKKELDLKAEHLKDLEQRLQESRRQLVESEQQVGALRQKITNYEALLAQREEIEDQYARLQGLRVQEEQLNRKQNQQMELTGRRSSLELAIQRAKGEVERQEAALLTRVHDLERRAQGIEKEQRELEEAQRQLEELAGLEKERDAQRAQDKAIHGDLERFRAQNVQLRGEMAKLKERIATLSALDGRCPLCGSDLSHDRCQELAAQLEAEGRQMRATFDQNAADIKRLEASAEKAQKEMAALDARLRHKDPLQRKAAALEKSLADAQEAQRQLAGLQEELRAVRERLARGDYAPAERPQLAQVVAAIEALGYDPTEHQQIRTELARLAPYQERQAQLRMAQEALPQERAALERAQKAAEHWRTRSAEEERQHQTLAQELAGLPVLRDRLARAEREFSVLLTQRHRLSLELGQAQQKLMHCDYLAQQRQEKLQALTIAAEEKGLYDELALAFGKKGLQAMIIETAIPEIEAEANALLARMTDNRMSVRFETQRAAKVGAAGRPPLLETLDIKISDELGTRSYELYSGGEAFRVNFAIRIALSKLLARRAGARLQTLVIDEGFGTQDSQGRDRLVEAINSISPDFEKILVITHIEELKDLFPVRIDVTKTAEGSQIAIS